MLPGGYASVLQTRDRDEFREEVVRFTRRLGFETVSALTVIDHGLGKSEFIAVDNRPAEYTDAYFDTTLARRDPVMQHCKRQSVPIIWDQATYAEQGMAEGMGAPGALRLPHWHCDGPAPAGRQALRPRRRS